MTERGQKRPPWGGGRALPGPLRGCSGRGMTLSVVPPETGVMSISSKMKRAEGL